ncbi:carbamoyl phosphate synthase small subunit [Candidatus Desantisbacteria bacterium CG2_30_40_21]|uniref:Carbamoyl phosphate synthase small chain n=5 Tax=unclassified Candidatus Desantisiibacteriota TaxID=3106372 RepID=A0A2M7J9Z5_9BACT|nr:MAG: carbamoyl phosphate synthase small subunit [Candidatus Desantisbacteria bacterium CG2_30_40_21]PIP41365.1 MAG: carbamoyl phosphate synthase small subunit [Candidatus Desantisbacteria bacterium CG23_combo_of_CG06-09_8_20_14_all_40_23]PIX16193.1 MAG: carbamoyl phosphate synthase small subunit [Candidatus Desantisbacteria bacterium CG_4_8_14_3_um_filter_40_12]PIY19925.1 MAG: carbamoyl phosphate synthase small subunit [Candidatus Desantisbacteria bacterium CG_4_10_14_3_um_filter_40_18]PJB28
MKAMIALEDGRIFEGSAFGAMGEARGEMVFNTSMTGYQEILTDPSYKGQIVTMTYPLIGNYGVNDEDMESFKPHAGGLIVKEYSPIYSNWRAKKSLHEFLEEYGIIGIEGVDTRALTKHIRTCGAMRAVISTKDLDSSNLIAKAKTSPNLVGKDLVKEVTCDKPYQWQNNPQSTAHSSRFTVVAMDFGIKHNILRMLENAGCCVTVVPANTTAEEIRSYKPDGIFLSNGPGDPEGVSYAIETVKQLIYRLPILPIFGICLGHQILGLALGGKTYKLKFGHRGGNQPVKDLTTGKIDITSQNHGFCVDGNSMNPEEIEITHINPNDQTIEGMRHKTLPIFSVQYHPEASPGPHDADYLFDRFVGMMK